MDAADKTERLGNATFEIRKMDDALVDTVTTDENGRVFLSLEDGSYYAVEIEAPEGYKLDNTPHYFEVKNGKTSKLTITNTAMSGIIIHKTDSTTGKGSTAQRSCCMTRAITPLASTPAMTRAISTSRIWNRAATICGSWRTRVTFSILSAKPSM